MEQQKNSQEMPIDLIELLLVLKKRIVIIAAAFVLGIVIMGSYTVFLVTPMYSATASLYILPTSSSIASLSDFQFGAQLSQDYPSLIKTHAVIDEVIENLGLNMSYGEVAGKISTSNPSSTRMLNITVTDAVPETAQKIANELASVAVKKVAEIMKTEEPSIVEEAYLPASPYNINIKKSCAMGGLIGIVISAGIIISLHLLNDRLYTEEDVERYLGLTTLGVIPGTKASRMKIKKPEVGK